MSKMNRRTNPTADAPLLEHLEELRTRLLLAIGFWIAGACVGWIYRGDLINVLQGPLESVRDRVKVVTTALTDQLFISFSVALWGGFILALPFILHQLWMFIEPGLTRQERRWAIPFILGAGLSFGLGSVFCYLIILPAAIPFLVAFLPAQAQVENLFSLAKYINDVLSYLVTFGLVFEMPIAAFLLTKIGFITAKLLRDVRRYALVVLLILAAVITPTADPINLALMAGPMYLLYELSILVSSASGPRKVRTRELEEIEI